MSTILGRDDSRPDLRGKTMGLSLHHCIVFLSCLMIAACATKTHPILLSDIKADPIIFAAGPTRSTEALGHSSTQDTRLQWIVANRFRVIDGEVEEARFYHDLAAYWEEVWAWSNKEKDAGYGANILNSDLIHSRPSDFGRQTIKKNYKTHYISKSHSYDYPQDSAHSVKWALDRARLVRVLWPTSSLGEVCEWELVDGKTAIVLARKRGACTTALKADSILCEQRASCFEVNIDHNYILNAKRIATGENASTPIRVSDKTIVALGDSFSAGEGNPHAAWRIRGEHRHPAFWWDARCHRSLLSGPSVAAAIYARKHPHETVTFLHYGCSGGSIDDGVARPWRLLETHQEHKEFHADWMDKQSRYQRIPISQTTECASHIYNGVEDSSEMECPDIVPSQIALAVHDLSQSSVYPSDVENRSLRKKSGSPVIDHLIISVGGNDVGFAGFVSAIAQVGLAEDLKLLPEPDYRKDLSTDENRFAYQAVVASKLLHDVLCEKTNINRICVIAETLLTDQSTFPYYKQARRAYETLSEEQRDETRKLINEIIGDKPNNKDRRDKAVLAAHGRVRILLTIPQQYAYLMNQVNERLAPRDVVVTAYPSALTFIEPKRPTEKSYCKDVAFDKRPGFIPGVLAIPKNIGVREDVAKLGTEEVHQLLNDTIKTVVEGATEQVRKNEPVSWRFASDAMATLSTPFGVCSIDGKMLFTVIDSAYYQGAVESLKKPIGTIAVRDHDGATTAIWDHQQRCYVGQSGKSEQEFHGCVTQNGQDSSLRFHKERLRKNDNASEKDRKGGWVPKGAFHPSPLGHCVYALNLIDVLDKDIARIPEVFKDWDWESGKNFPVTEAKEALLQVCSAKALGFTAKKSASHAQASAP